VTKFLLFLYLAHSGQMIHVYKGFCDEHDCLQYGPTVTVQAMAERGENVKFICLPGTDPAVFGFDQ
jgi:hypothetical protein